MRIAALILAAAFMLAGAASAQQTPAPPPAANFTPPRLIHQPDADAMMALYPPHALAQGVIGRISTVCLIGADGVARDCVAESVNTQGWGFEEAALHVSRSLRYEPAQRDGRATPVRIRRGILFRIPAANDHPYEDVPFADEVLDWPLADLPSWDDAPPLADVNTAFPQAAREQGVQRGRGVLACRANDDRTLACDLQSETPANLGFGPAALSLSRRFRISEFDADYATAHRTAPFTLAINFGFRPEEEPVSTLYHGIGVFRLLAPAHIAASVYPAKARTAHASGEATTICVLTDANLHCRLQSEEPQGFGFGEAALAAMAAAPPLPASDMDLMPGDEIRFTFRFRPE